MSDELRLDTNGSCISGRILNCWPETLQYYIQKFNKDVLILKLCLFCGAVLSSHDT